MELVIVARGGNFYLNILIHPKVMTMKVMEIFFIFNIYKLLGGGGKGVH